VLPRLVGDPIRVEIRPSLGSHLAGASIPHRLILLDVSVLARRGEFERILIHELFHFAWVRLSNQQRVAWEQVLAGELRKRIKGELGWSAEWRKNILTGADPRLRTPKWRRYACESFATPLPGCLPACPHTTSSHSPRPPAECAGTGLRSSFRLAVESRSDRTLNTV